MATSLSGPLSDTGGCLISQRFALATISGRPLQKPRMKSPVLCLLSCTALRGSDGFTAPYQFARDRLTAIGEDVSLIREKLVEGKPVPELDLQLKRLSADHNKTLTQIGESIAVLHAES